ncbi:putative F-box protein At3g16210 [Lactuca sativa]|nr:putative F-box protein At3g16210 [Lactuca sativa]
MLSVLKFHLLGKMQDYTMSDYLCQELIIAIFTRLPPKSLLRFRSLSKSWYSYISSPSFIRMHGSRSTQKLLFRHHLRYGFEYFRTLLSDDFYTLHSEDQLPMCPTEGYNGITAVQFPCSRDFIIVGSCDGIFCLSEHQKGISLWNPSIRRKQSLPNCPWRPRDPLEGFGLALGFGFDPISDDYKIVQISYPRESSYFYSLKTGTWCAIASPTPFFSEVRRGIWGSCFVNGALHWVVDRYHTESHHSEIPCIMTFDLSTHVFGMIPLPEPFQRLTRLTTFQGFLAMISTYDNNSYYRDCWIWVRRDDSWSVVYKSKENQFKGGSIMGVLQPTINRDFLLSAMNDQGMEVYLIKMGTQSRLVEFHAASFISEIVQCVESLHLLENACEANQLLVS